MKSNVKRLNGLCFALYFVFFTVQSININAQQIEGIYLSGVDFQNQKISFAKQKGKKCKVKLHDFIYKPFITVKFCDSVFTLRKDSVFGYKDLFGKNNRFFNKRIYPVLNQSEPILLYRTESRTGNLKSPNIEIRFFFSKDADSPILPLTIRNLETCFKDNNRFIEYLKMHFKNDSGLSEYDYVNKMYKINRLLELSIKPKTN